MTPFGGGPEDMIDHEKSVNLDAFNAAFDGMVVRTSVTILKLFSNSCGQRKWSS